jgi:lipopolysaccharide export system permease protein
MRILDRYLLTEFVTYLALGMFGLMTLFMVVDVFEKIDVFLDNRAQIFLIARYYLFQLPEWVVLVMPIALLLATFLSLGQLNKFGELTAMRVSGLSLTRILWPVFAIAVAATLGTFLFNEVVVPHSNQVRDHVYEEEIRRLRRGSPAERADVTYLGEGGRIYFIRLYVVSEKRMHEVSLQEFRRGALLRRIDASEATWENDRWVFTSGYVRSFDKDGNETAQPFTRMAVNGLLERPDDFARESLDPKEMNARELMGYLTRLRASGARVANYLVDLHLKFAFPLINIIVVMIGAAVATRLRMQSAALGFGLSIGISFLFYSFIRAGQALGHSGALPPYLAAWLADMVFGSIGLFMMARAQRT